MIYIILIVVALLVIYGIAQSRIGNDFDHNVASTHYENKIHKKEILSEKLKNKFVLSTYESYDIFALHLVEDMKIHKTEDLVFYNHSWRYDPLKKR